MYKLVSKYAGNFSTAQRKQMRVTFNVRCTVYMHVRWICAPYVKEEMNM